MDEYEKAIDAAKAALSDASTKLQNGAVPDPDGAIHKAFELPSVKSAFTNSNSEIIELRGKLDQVYELMKNNKALQKQFPDIMPNLQNADIHLFNLSMQGHEFIIKSDGTVMSASQMPQPLGMQAKELQTAYTQVPYAYTPDGPGF